MKASEQISEELKQYIDPVKREYLPRFFKTGVGQYGEGGRQVSGSGCCFGNWESGTKTCWCSFSKSIVG